MCVKYLVDLWNEVMTWCHTMIKAPTLLILTVTCPNIMKLDWTTNSTNENGFYIYRSLDGNNWILIDTVGAGVITYTDNSGLVDILYYYRVQAFNSTEISDFSNIESGICELTDIKYGILYNWYAATDAKNITNTGWHVPTQAELTTLVNYLGGAVIAGGKLKEIGLIYWNLPNTGATNSSLFNGRGAGKRRGDNGSFVLLKDSLSVIASDLTVGFVTAMELSSAGANATIGSLYPEDWGFSIRPIKDITILSDGEEGTYTGNDGKVYRTICIGTQEWLADDLAETLYRDLTPIPEEQNDAAWAALITGALCYYNNDTTNM